MLSCIVYYLAIYGTVCIVHRVSCIVHRVSGINNGRVGYNIGYQASGIRQRVFGQLTQQIEMESQWSLQKIKEAGTDEN